MTHHESRPTTKKCQSGGLVKEEGCIFKWAMIYYGSNLRQILNGQGYSSGSFFLEKLN